MMAQTKDQQTIRMLTTILDVVNSADRTPPAQAYELFNQTKAAIK